MGQGCCHRQCEPARRHEPDTSLLAVAEGDRWILVPVDLLGLGDLWHCGSGRLLRYKACHQGPDRGTRRGVHGAWRTCGRCPARHRGHRHVERKGQGATAHRRHVAVLPAQAIADTVWAAYAGDRLHWYMPAELSDYDVEVTRRPEAARDRRLAGGF